MELILIIWVMALQGAWDARETLVGQLQLLTLVGIPVALAVLAGFACRPEGRSRNPNVTCHGSESPVSRTPVATPRPAHRHQCKTPREEDWRSYTTPNGTQVLELGEPLRPLVDDEHRDLLLRLRLELAQARAEAEALRGEAVARVRGRLHSWRGKHAILAVADGEGHQRVLVAVPDDEDRDACAVGMQVEVIARFTGGRLTAERFTMVEECQDPLPELPELTAKASSIPNWFDSNAKNEKRPFLKASDGSSSVSELRVHLVWATKRRGKVLTAKMVERLKVLTAEVIKEKALGRLLAVNAEEDHVHVAVWLPANLAGSEAAGIIKSFTSRHLRREFPGLRAHHDEALWQRGCFVGSIGAAGHLEAVLSYIAQQNTPEASQDDQEEALPSTEGKEASEA